MQSRALGPSSFLIAWLALAGVVGPIVFTVLVIAQSVAQPDYSDLSLPISALAAWPMGWLQNLNFFVFGSLMTAYAIGLQLGIRPSRWGILGFILLIASGLGLLLAGAFPLQGAESAFVVPPGHQVAGVMTFFGAGSGLIVISRRMTGDPRWRDRAGYALASGLAMLLLFVAIGVLAVSDDAPLHHWAGLMQWLTLAVWFPCIIVLALRLRRISVAAGA